MALAAHDARGAAGLSVVVLALLYGLVELHVRLLAAWVRGADGVRPAAGAAQIAGVAAGTCGSRLRPPRACDAASRCDRFAVGRYRDARLTVTVCTEVRHRK
ncbi:hypothetical protein GCM10010170_003580 [Dactylosporangium salmoneum]|uniref:Secreted protein n=1 Tax=Dactylosporangium salmoneum TaxID=53361 RepID=A0ABN3FDW3_9ACTN